MSIYSLLFNDAVSGNGLLASEVDLRRKQEIENGSTLFGERYGVSEENSPRGREKKREKEQAANARLARLLADPAYRAAYDSLQDTIDDSRRKLDEWNRRIEDRRVEIERLLNDPNNPVTAAEREALIDEDERLLRIQQDGLDIRARADDIDTKAKRGEFESVEYSERDEDDFRQIMKYIGDRVEANFEQSAQDHEYVQSDEPHSKTNYTALSLPSL